MIKDHGLQAMLFLLYWDCDSWTSTSEGRNSATRVGKREKGRFGHFGGRGSRNSAVEVDGLNGTHHNLLTLFVSLCGLVIIPMPRAVEPAISSTIDQICYSIVYKYNNK